MGFKSSSGLELTIARSQIDDFPAVDDPLVQVWHDYDGNICAYAYSLNDAHWLHFPDVATYRINPAAAEIVAFPLGGADEKIIDVFFRVVVPIVLHIRGTEVLHASAVMANGGVVAFCAMSETGKSTTAFALTQRGYLHWADDALAFQIEEGTVTALPLPFGTRLHPDAENHLGKVANLNHGGPDSRQPTALSMLVVLERSVNTSDPDVDVVRLSPPDAFRAVLLHAHFFNLKRTELKKQMVSNYMELTSLVPVVKVQFRPGFEKLPKLLDELERILLQP